VPKKIEGQSSKPLVKQQQIQELIHCGKDPNYFIKKYLKIHHPQRGVIPFETYNFQEDCINAFREHRLNIILKSRQLGLSTITAAYATWLAIFYKAKNVLVIATKLATAQNFIKKVQTFLQTMPKWLLITTFEQNQRAIRFSNGSVITAIPTSEDAGRSEALSLLICDECALIRNFDTLWTGLLPTVSTGGSVILLSTPYGIGGMYHKIWTDSVAGLNDFNPIKLPWNVHPEHNQSWFEKETRGLSPQQIAQEYECDFGRCDNTFLRPEDLEYVRMSIVAPMSRDTLDRNVWIWAEPKPNERYIMGADVSRGDANDFSAFSIVDSSFNVVVEYKGKIPPDKLASLMARVGHVYNDALLCPEVNTFGYITATKLRDIRYKRLYYSSMKTNFFDSQPAYDEDTPGFTTNVKSRAQALAKLEELIRNRVLKVYSQRLFDELQMFIWSEGRAQSKSKSANDDIVMSLAITSWLADQVFSSPVQNRADAAALISAMSVTRRESSSTSH
jgi:hypothetical protein